MTKTNGTGSAVVNVGVLRALHGVCLALADEEDGMLLALGVGYKKVVRFTFFRNSTYVSIVCTYVLCDDAPIVKFLVYSEEHMALNNII